MPPHEAWLARAQEDLAVANLCLREKYFSQTCFFSQQAVEKSLKAFLLAKGRSYPRQHKVVKLVTLCHEIAGRLAPLKDDLKLLDEFYIPTRYPDAIPGSLPEGLPSQQDAQTALSTAEKIFQMIREEIPPF